MSKNSGTQQVSMYNRLLNGIERVGNSLPNPIALFAIFALAIVVISAVCAAMGVSATGMLISGGEANTERTAIMLLDEFRSAKIGRMTLDRYSKEELPDA